MAKKRYTAEQIVGMLREAEAQLAKGLKVKAVCQHLKPWKLGQTIKLCLGLK